MMNRRTFIRAAAAGGGLLAAGRLGPGSGNVLHAWTGGTAARPPLRFPPTVSPAELTLVARPSPVDVGGRAQAAWTFNGGLPGPTIRARRGERARIVLENALPEPTIVHWHGLHVPVEADGHPRLAVPAGATYRYDFTIEQRAGTYWYHPHPHMRTAAQTYQGLAGLLIVEDEEEEAVGLPAGEREVLLVLQDRRVGDGGPFRYAPAGPDLMQGLLGDTPFGNGVASPSLAVDAALYRVRILNGSNARIYRLALHTGAPLVVIGNDGGLLPAPAAVPYVDIAPAERVDLLMDLSGVAPGERVLLRSLPFTIPGLMGMGGMGRMGRGAMGRGPMGGGSPQGTPMDLVEFLVGRRAGERAVIPTRLPAIRRLADERVGGERTFRFSSRMMRHTINGRAFGLSRVDERVPLGRLERWTFVNDDQFAHPIHVHATHFQVEARRGGRGAVLPWERGWKDTVLLLPGEQVDALLRFDANPGLFLLHCHNLEHEDGGMMLNFEVAG
jgi:FtsP/CotA-like multicopper oxidase with cupredoxin domain